MVSVILILLAVTTVLLICFMAAERADKRKELLLHELPEDATCDIEPEGKKVACAKCGKRLCYGDTVPSVEIISVTGEGYAVCKACYVKELY